MKIPLASALASAALFAGCSVGAPVSYTIQGHDPSFVDGRWMYVLSFASADEEIIDSARIENHAFTMKGRYPYPVSAYLYMGRGAEGVQISASDFILESGEIVVEKRGEQERPRTTFTTTCREGSPRSRPAAARRSAAPRPATACCAPSCSGTAAPWP